MNGYALHWVFRTSQLKPTLDFLEQVLGMSTGPKHCQGLEDHPRTDTLVHSHGNRLGPLRIGWWDPFQMAFFCAYKWALLTRWTTWDDPPRGMVYLKNGKFKNV